MIDVMAYTYEQRIEDLEKERDALKVHCDLLRGDLQYFVDRVEDGSIRSRKTYARYLNRLEQTPQQSLAEIQADAVVKFFIQFERKTYWNKTINDVISEGYEYANDLRKQAYRERKVDEAFAVIVKGGE
jgi:hypothetical protein